MNSKSLWVKVILAFSVALAAPRLWAQDGLEGALRRASFASPANLAAPFAQKFAVADFDNDHKPDGAVLVDSGPLGSQNSFRVELHLSGSTNTDLSFESTETNLGIAAWDINKDGATDLIVEQPLTQKRLHVWLNDGHGGFHKGRIDDFPSGKTAIGERLESPSPRPDCPMVCLGPQRGTEIEMLTARLVPGRPPSASKFKALSIASPPSSPALSPNSSRAPPLL